VGRRGCPGSSGTGCSTWSSRAGRSSTWRAISGSAPSRSTRRRRQDWIAKGLQRDDVAHQHPDRPGIGERVEPATPHELADLAVHDVQSGRPGTPVESGRSVDNFFGLFENGAVRGPPIRGSVDGHTLPRKGPPGQVNAGERPNVATAGRTPTHPAVAGAPGPWGDRPFSWSRAPT
jgi:hypothetical protein